MHIYILTPFQIIIRLIFLTSSLTTHCIQKFMQSITFFVMTCFVNKKIFKDDLNLH